VSLVIKALLVKVQDKIVHKMTTFKLYTQLNHSNAAKNTG